MARKKKKTPTKIDPNALKTRDPLIQKLIGGATKAGVQKDKKKEASKTACRDDVERVCMQCNNLLSEGVYTDTPDGFCSDYCMEAYNNELTDY